MPGNPNLTFFHIIKARNQLNQAWFTRTRSTKDTNNFTRLNIQSDIFEDMGLVTIFIRVWEIHMIKADRTICNFC